MTFKLNIDLCIPPRFAWGVFTIVKERENLVLAITPFEVLIVHI